MFSHALAQERRTISGTVRNAETGEALIGATVSSNASPAIGTITNAYGFYSLTLPIGLDTAITRYLGFKEQRVAVPASGDRSLNIELVPELLREKEVVITGERTNRNVTSTEMGISRLETREIQAIPVLLGERDILKTIQLLPGIKSLGEGNTVFSARGGAADQNLILLDEAPVYNSSHLLGYLSVFNADAIKDVKLVTGGMPAEYGGRLSSVLDIRTNDGNAKNYSGSAGIGLLDTRGLFEGPLGSDQGSFLLTGRRTYADLFLRLSSDTTINRTRLYFYDLNLKANYRLGQNDQVYLSGYFGRDNFDYPDVFGFDWGNATATVRWNHVYNPKLFSNLSLIFSDYSYSNTVGPGTSRFVITSGIKDINAKTDVQYFPESNVTMKFGFNSIHHTFTPGSITAAPIPIPSSLVIEKRYAWENAAYISGECSPIPVLKLNAGLRISAFSLLGPGTFYTYDEFGDVMDSSIYSSGQFVKTFATLEPRLAATWQFNEQSSVKASFARTAQYLHLLSNSTTTNPSDLWVPSSQIVPPQQADQYSVGYFRNFLENAYESSVEFYYKDMRNMIEYRNGADLQLNPAVESLLLFGSGRSYGAEFLLKKNTGDFTGWVSYTISKTEEEFAHINNGQVFPSRYDRTHDVSLVGIWKYDTHWTFSAAWVYYTGNAVTYPGGNYIIGGRFLPYFTERNGYRMPAYHRLDLSVTYAFGPHSNLNFSLYNAYNRANAFAIYFRLNHDDPTKTEAVQMTLFPIIPSITYNLTF